jgi:NAD(P)-dependent dehydrogenase (short-subunit alcohol dehydrogenase family)
MAREHAESDVWRGRVAVVTGGNSGIGRAFVERLAANGAKVIACGRNEATLRGLRNENRIIETYRCDITIRQDVLALASAIQDRHGRLDVLINNAGIMEQVNLLDETVSDDRIAYERGQSHGHDFTDAAPSAAVARWPRSLDRHDQLRVRTAPSYARTNLLGNQGWAAFLRYGAASSTVGCRHPSCRGLSATHRYTGNESRKAAENAGGCIGRPRVTRYRKWT